MKNWFKRNFNIIAIDLEAIDLLEDLMIAAIVAIILVRSFLYLTGYPQIAGGSLHMAHLLWGGLFMLAAIVILIVFMNRGAKIIASTLAGIGLGLFIDELGKFITADNNYFFQPTFALIYMFFVILFLLIRTAQRLVTPTDKTYLVNSLKMLQEAILLDLDDQEKKKAQYYLDQVNISDPLVKQMKKLFANIKPEPKNKVNLISTIKNEISNLYTSLVNKKWFAHLITAWFIITSLLQLLYPLFYSVQNSQFTLTFAQKGQLFFGVVAGGLVLAGGYYMLRGNRLRSYELFRTAVLISIFFIQFFVFWEEQFTAVFGLVYDVLVYGALGVMIQEEKLRSHKHSSWLGKVSAIFQG